MAPAPDSNPRARHMHTYNALLVDKRPEVIDFYLTWNMVCKTDVDGILNNIRHRLASSELYRVYEESCGKLTTYVAGTGDASSRGSTTVKITMFRAVHPRYRLVEHPAKDKGTRAGLESV